MQSEITYWNRVWILCHIVFYRCQFTYLIYQEFMFTILTTMHRWGTKVVWSRRLETLLWCVSYHYLLLLNIKGYFLFKIILCFKFYLIPELFFFVKHVSLHKLTNSSLNKLTFRQNLRIWGNCNRILEFILAHSIHVSHISLHLPYKSTFL